MPSNVARLPSRPARPTIEIGGEQQARLEAGLVEYAISDSIDGIANAELRFGNWGGEDQPGFQYFDRQTLDFGKELSVKMGGDILFKGKISAICAHYPEGGQPQISVLAEDRLQDLRMVRRTRSFEQKSLADVARTIASDHGLQVMADTSGPTYAALAQVNQSDLAFLHALARSEGAQVYISDDRLVVKALHDHAAVELAWAGTLRSFERQCRPRQPAHRSDCIGLERCRQGGVKFKAEKAALGNEIGSGRAPPPTYCRRVLANAAIRSHTARQPPTRRRGHWPKQATARWRATSSSAKASAKPTPKYGWVRSLI